VNKLVDEKHVDEFSKVMALRIRLMTRHYIMAMGKNAQWLVDAGAEDAKDVAEVREKGADMEMKDEEEEEDGDGEDVEEEQAEEEEEEGDGDDDESKETDQPVTKPVAVLVPAVSARRKVAPSASGESWFVGFDEDWNTPSL
jgi:hypothetical protein